MVLKEGLFRRDLLEGLCLPEIEKQKLKKKTTNPNSKQQRIKTQKQVIAVKKYLNINFTAKLNRYSLSTFSKTALKLQVTNCKDSDISVLLHNFSQFLNYQNNF